MKALPLIIILVITVLDLAGWWMTFTKAGQRGWTSIIPILNIFVLLKIVKRPLWWFILFIIPIVSFIVWIIIALDLAKKFGKGAGFAIGLIFLPFIFFPVLGFGSATYQDVPEPLF